MRNVINMNERLKYTEVIVPGRHNRMEGEEIFFEKKWGKYFFFEKKGARIFFSKQKLGWIDYFRDKRKAKTLFYYNIL